MTKTCQLCASEFKAKRSDAAYCSEKCRAKANYQIRKRKDNNTFSADNYEDNSTISLTDKSVDNVQICIKGCLSLEEIIQIITNCEDNIEHINTLKCAFLDKNTTINAQKMDLQYKYDDIIQGQVEKLQLILTKSDATIYNRFLNGEYIEAKKNGNSLAKMKLKSEKDLQDNYDYELQQSLNNYKLKIENKIISFKAEANHINSKINNLSALTESNNARLNELAQQIKFYQNRIIRFEQILSG